MSLEVVGSHTLHAVVHFVLFLSLSEFSQSGCNWVEVEILYLPYSISDLGKKILLGSDEGLTKEDLAHWELPLLGEFVFDYQVCAVFWGKVQTPSVLQVGIYIRPMLTSSTVFALKA